MVNTSEFIERLNKVLGFYDLSASVFADKIGVQRSSISHLLSGRNKPSLEFVLKVISAFPDVDLYWLLNGKGSFPSRSKTNDVEKEIVVAPETQPKKPIQQYVDPSEKHKTIEKIIIFYTDGSFKAYNENG
ncbi:DNA-binding transcriptional regulator, XRE-family HTH domain [Arenibacter nanhaiticus]|uniref:DNA-binding transcriptional regulator, XRE-family HTH domain n=1 Tax=Arenibacter nanhaiticus TaxID=558155 RepID=A0A1M6DH69_9FLAO|nr:helix-turn-helix transcriptional regulator [Arenibacter nanhaiticus]SHI72535.1 DNA-binding transcriptional regulator, XRE-family HTH domain [Arenibacter nanhaiticus]